MKKYIFVILASLFSLVQVVSQAASPRDLLILPEDLRVERTSGGYNLFVRKKAGLESVMLAETTKDPLGKEDNYAYRAKEYNPVNGDEVRILDGDMIDFKSRSLYFLIDSTPQEDEQFGKAFLIFIPEEIEYGYSWTRSGSVTIGKGTFINIRGFEKKYCDYTGAFLDNPYMFDFVMPKLPKIEVPDVTENLEASAATASDATEAKDETEEVTEAPEENETAEDVSADESGDEEETETSGEAENTEDETDEEDPKIVGSNVPADEIIVLTDDYNPIAAEKFKEISDMMVYSKGPDTLLDDISSVLQAIEPKDLVDIVFAVDATGSMADDIDILRKELMPHLLKELRSFGDVRLGLLFYRDYGDDFNYRALPVKCFNFTRNVDDFMKNLNSIRIRGTEGGDIPEPVYEALYASMDFYIWRKKAVKRVILIGDAEQHPVPRRTKKYTKTLVEKMSSERDIGITAIILPDNKKRRGR